MYVLKWSKRHSLHQNLRSKHNRREHLRAGAPCEVRSKVGIWQPQLAFTIKNLRPSAGIQGKLVCQRINASLNVRLLAYIDIAIAFCWRLQLGPDSACAGGRRNVCVVRVWQVRRDLAREHQVAVAVQSPGVFVCYCRGIIRCGYPCRYTVITLRLVVEVVGRVGDLGSHY